MKLKPLGYSLALKGLRRAELNRAWAQREYDVMLYSVLPTPALVPGLSLVLELAGAQATHGKALASLPSPTDAATYEKAVTELERKWRGELDLIPLFAQGLPISAAPELQGLSFDGFGRLRLENLFLSAEPQ